MENKNNFPIQQNTTYIPEGFLCFAVDLESKPHPALKFINCNAIIAVESPSGWKIRRSGMSELEHLDLFFVQSGSIRIRTAKEELTARRGQVLAIPSWIDREIVLDLPGNHIYVRFDNPKKHFPISQVTVKNSRNVDTIGFYIKILLENPEFPDEALYRSHLVECLIILFQRELFSTSQKSPPEKTQKLLNFLQTANATSLSVKSVCKQFGMSFSAFRRFCLENFGKVPSELINDIRISRARALLSYSNLTIDDIAAQLGYADRFTFTKAFTRLTSQSPAAFRKYKNETNSKPSHRKRKVER